MVREKFGEVNLPLHFHHHRACPVHGVVDKSLCLKNTQNVPIISVIDLIIPLFGTKLIMRLV